MFRCFKDWARCYGPIISVWFGSTLNVVVSSSELAKEVLKENDQQLADRRRFTPAAKVSKDGKDLLWAGYGPHYVKIKTLCTAELFSPKRLEALRLIREDEATSMVESIFKDCTNPGIYFSFPHCSSPYAFEMHALLNGTDHLICQITHSFIKNLYYELTLKIT